ncbi:hypothetical protein FRC09_019652 [Ceratobasidium sp. 395]|nr:hypothetical protein FRC09_019652 [Ceratobasidium sp. 395]
MKLGDFAAWITVDDDPQVEHNVSTKEPERMGQIVTNAKFCYIVAEMNTYFEVNWRYEGGMAPEGHDLHFELKFHNRRVTQDTVRSYQLYEDNIIDGNGFFEFGSQETTGMILNYWLSTLLPTMKLIVRIDSDDKAKPSDPEVATIVLKFQWVKPCLKRRGHRRCIECEKESGSPQQKRARCLTPDQSPNLQPGLVHERAKKAHGVAAMAYCYEPENNVNPEDGDWHGTFKQQTKFEYRYGPRNWLDDQGIIDCESQVPQSESSDAHEVVDLCDSEPEDIKPRVTPSPINILVKQEPSSAGNDQSGLDKLAGIVGQLAREFGQMRDGMAQTNAGLRQMNENIAGLVQVLERKAQNSD